MDNQNIVKLKISGELNHIKDEKIKDLLKQFILEEDFIFNPNKSFINACIKNNLIGSSSIIIAERFKTQTIINNIFKSLSIESNVDFMDRELLKEK